jgi:hypothetical protein
MSWLEGAWSAEQVVAMTLTEAWLKSSTDPDLNMVVCLAGASLDGTGGSALYVFAVQDRRQPIVHQGTPTAEVFTISLAFNNDAEWEAFKELRDLAEPVLLQTPYGDGVLEQFWLRLGDVTTTRYTTDDMGDQQARVVTIQAVEVAVPGGP